MLSINHSLITGGYFTGGSNWNKEASSIDQCFKLYFLEYGQASIYSKGEKYELKAGYWYFINGFNVSAQECRESFSVSWLHFIPDSVVLKRFLQKIPAVVAISEGIDLQPSQQIFSEFFGKLKYNTTPDAEYISKYIKIHSIVNSCVSHLLNIFESLFINQVESKTFERVLPAISYIEENFQTRIKISNLASLCYLSGNYFHQLFKSATGLTPYDYVLQLRMDEAVRLLSGTKLPVKGIAFRTGYNDVAHFTRIFKSYFGITPGQYRLTFNSRTP